MSFLSPLAFLLLSLAAPLLLLYFLKVQRREQRVASTLLWEPVLRDQRASALFQRLQRDPLLWLQLAALILLVMALARPTVNLVGKGTDRLVVVMDVSASMKGTDVSPSRWVAVQTQALALLDQMDRGGEMMVIEAGVQPRVVVPFTRDRSALRRAINGLAPKDIATGVEPAILTAKALSKFDPNSRILVLTDGAFDLSANPDLRDPKVQWYGVGRRGRNVAITGLALRKSYFGAYEHQAFISLVNFADESVPFTLRVSLDGTPVSEQAITLEPKVKRNLIVPFTHQGGGVLRAEIDVDDDLAADNVAHGIIPAPRQIYVLLVSPGNLFLEKALRSDPQVKLDVKTPGGYTEGMDGHDVVVLDGVSSKRIGDGRFLLINSLAEDVPLEPLGTLEKPVIVDWDRTHPILRYVDLSKVALEEALRVRPLSAGKTLVESVGGPLLYTLEEPRRKLLFVGIDLFRTDLPLRVAFPLILSNALRWLHPVGLEANAFMVKGGHPLFLPVEQGVESVTIQAPDGRTWEVKVTRGVVSFSQTGEVGLYQMETRGGSQRVAVNLVDEGESNIAPHSLPQVNAPTGQGSGEAVRIPREFWGIFVLLALALLLLEASLFWRRQSGGRLFLPGGTVDRLALGVRGFMCMLLLLALLRPQLPRMVDRLNVLFLLDQSDSITLAAQEGAFQFASQALGGMRNDDRAGYLTFGAQAAVEASLRPKPIFQRPRDRVLGQATNIQQAIELALATFPRDEAARIVLLSDGNENAGSALSAAQAARDQGVEIYYWPLGLTFPNEVVVEQLLIPGEVKYGEPFYVRVLAWAHREGNGRISLYRNGEFLGSQFVHLSAGKNVFTYRQSLESTGVHVYQAYLAAGGDTVEENNRAVGLTVVRGKPVVLLAEKDRGQAQHLLGALRSQNIDVEVVGPEGIPRDVADFERYDGVILSNVSSLKMTRKQMESIQSYVRDRGGGLLMMGGEESFGLGGYYKTPIEETLPVTMEVKQKVEIPSLAALLIIDRSGSMGMGMADNDRVTKLDVAKEATHLVVELLDERNEVGVMSFDTEFAWHVPMGRAEDKGRISREIASIKLGGGTDGYPAMKEGYQALFDRNAVLKHIIFLSDGQMTRGDFSNLVRRLAKDKITVSSVAIGKDSDVQLMFDIAKWGKGRFYYTEDTLTIPRIFTLETQLASKASLVEQPFRPVLVSNYHEIVQEIDWSKVPPLGGYVASTVKSAAEQILTTHQEDPLLTVWRYGLGRAVAFTSDAKAKWGILWLRWPAFNKFWSQTIRWMLRTQPRSDTVTTLERRDGQGVITVEAVDGKGEFINFLETQVGVVAPDKLRTVVDLEQVAPGRYLGAFPAKEEGVYLVGLAPRKEKKMLGSQLAGLVIPYSPEFRKLGVEEANLLEISELTGGGALHDPKDAFQLARKRSRLLIEIWSWLVMAATLLLVPEIALRRIGLFLWRRWRAVRDRGKELQQSAG